MASHVYSSACWKLYSQRNRRPFRRRHTQPNSVLLRDCVQRRGGAWHIMWQPKSVFICHHAFDGLSLFGPRELSMFLQVAATLDTLWFLMCWLMNREMNMNAFLWNIECISHFQFSRKYLHLGYIRSTAPLHCYCWVQLTFCFTGSPLLG